MDPTTATIPANEEGNKNRLRLCGCDPIRPSEEKWTKVMSPTASKDIITLRGSVAIVIELGAS